MRAPDLSSTIELFDKYYRLMHKIEPAFNKDLAGEAKKRLTQLQKILSIVQALDDETREFFKRLNC